MNNCIENCDLFSRPVFMFEEYYLKINFYLNSVSFLEQKMDRIFDLILWNTGFWQIQRKSISFCPMGPWAWLQKPKSCHYWLWGQCCPDRTCNWYLNLTQKFKFQFWYLPPFEDLLSWTLTDFANHISHFLTLPPLKPLS